MMIPQSKFTAQQLARLDVEIGAYHKKYIEDRETDFYDIEDLQIRLVSFRIPFMDQCGGLSGYMALQISAQQRLVHGIGARVFEGGVALSLDYTPGYPSTNARRTMDIPLRRFVDERPYTQFNFGMFDTAYPLIFDLKIERDEDRAPDAIVPTLDMILVCSLPSVTMLDQKFDDPRLDRIAKIVSVLEGSEQLKAEAAELLAICDGPHQK